MTAFTEQLRQANLQTWEQAAEHRFVQELFAGTIDDAVMAHSRTTASSTAF
ncbi:MAG: hypothetical protein Q4A97_00150 [Comamonadaceae bacterium]|nr:hypothetical protein [Comamonadaceae bacterium]